MTRKQMSATGQNFDAAQGADDGGRARSAKLDQRLQAHIGRQLKSMYDAYLSEPVPDHLIELLEELDKVQAAHTSARSDETDGEPA